MIVDANSSPPIHHLKWGIVRRNPGVASGKRHYTWSPASALSPTARPITRAHSEEDIKVHTGHNVYLNDLKDRYTEIFRTTARSSAARRGTSAGASLASYSNPT